MKASIVGESRARPLRMLTSGLMEFLLPAAAVAAVAATLVVIDRAALVVFVMGHAAARRFRQANAGLRQA